MRKVIPGSQTDNIRSDLFNIRIVCQPKKSGIDWQIGLVFQRVVHWGLSDINTLTSLHYLEVLSRHVACLSVGSRQTR